MVAVHVMPRFVNFGLQTSEIHPAPLLFLKTKRLQHVLFPFAMWQHCCYVHCWEGRHSLALNISQTATDTARVTIEVE